MIAIAMTLALLQDPPKPDEQLAEIKEQWTKIVALCREDKKEDVLKALAAMEMTREEMVALLGEEKAAKIYPSYQESWKDMLKEAPADLVKRANEEVDSWCLNTAEDKDLSGQDKALLAALAEKDSKVYAVRLRKKDAKDGLVLRYFVKTKDAWRFTLKLGKMLGDK